MTRTLTAAAALAALLVTAAPAHAGEKQALVTYADLDLTHAAGRAALDRRIAAAATRVCRADSRDLARKLAERRCRGKALDDSRPAVELARRAASGQRLALAAGNDGAQ